MLIDWFTVGAQALNFVILVWLMKRFLYKPILRAIDAREKRIAAALSDAQATMAKARAERDGLQQKNEELDRQRAALLHKAQEDAKSENERLVGQARAAADILRARRLGTLDAEIKGIYQDIHEQIQQEVFTIARRALTDLAATGLEERMVEVFIHRLHEVDDTVKEGFAGAIKTAPAPMLLVRSAFALPMEQREAIQKALNDAFSTEAPVRFETAPGLVSGIELNANGQKIAWSIADYLESLKTKIGRHLSQQRMPEPSSEANVAPALKEDTP